LELRSTVKSCAFLFMAVLEPMLSHR
jgi:hypothetical protein